MDRKTHEEYFNLPDNASAYQGNGRRKRVIADPIGLDGFPSTRRALNGMVTILCAELVRACGQTVRGRDLADLLFGTSDTRSVRKLVAYARVHKRLALIVGVPGSGYLWADPKTDAGRDALTTAAAASTQMARCFLYIAALHRRTTAVVSTVQMVLDFMGHETPEGQTQDDELAAMLAAEGAGIGDFLDALLGHLAKTDSGRQHLAAAGAKHAQVLITEEARQAMLAQIAEATAVLTGLGQTIRNRGQALNIKFVGIRPCVSRSVVAALSSLHHTYPHGCFAG